MSNPLLAKDGLLFMAFLGIVTMKRYSIGTLITLIGSLVAMPLLANQDTLSPDTIIASWDNPQDRVQTTQQAETLMYQARYPVAPKGIKSQVEQFIFYEKRRAQQQAGASQRPPALNLLILEARLLQSRHEFNAAESLFDRVDVERSAPALLLLSDIYLQLGDANKAKRACQQLVGKVSHVMAFTCILNANFAASETHATYAQLQKLGPFVDDARPEEQIWYYETLASMALALTLPEEAVSHIQSIQAEQLPISALLTWADAKQALGQPQDVLAKFSDFTGHIERLDDGILLRWGLAEKQAGIAQSKVQQQLAQRMALRVWREDVSHAAQVAIYHLDIEPNPEIAIKFAKLNWQHAKAKSDSALLERALNFAASQLANN